MIMKLQRFQPRSSRTPFVSAVSLLLLFLSLASSKEVDVAVGSNKKNLRGGAGALLPGDNNKDHTTDQKIDNHQHVDAEDMTESMITIVDQKKEKKEQDDHLSPPPPAITDLPIDGYCWVHDDGKFCFKGNNFLTITKAHDELIHEAFLDDGFKYSYSIINTDKLRNDVTTFMSSPSSLTNGNRKLAHAMANHDWIDAMEGTKFRCKKEKITTTQEMMNDNFITFINSNKKKEFLIKRNDDGSSIWQFHKWTVHVNDQMVPTSVTIPATSMMSEDHDSHRKEEEEDEEKVVHNLMDITLNISRLEPITSFKTNLFDACDSESADGFDSPKGTPEGHAQAQRILNAHNSSISEEEYFTIEERNINEGNDRKLGEAILQVFSNEQTGTKWCGPAYNLDEVCPDINRETIRGPKFETWKYNFAADNACRRHDHGVKIDEGVFGLPRMECAVDKDLWQAANNDAVTLAYGPEGLMGAYVGCSTYVQRRCTGENVYDKICGDWTTRFGPKRYDDATPYKKGYATKRPKLCPYDYMLNYSSPEVPNSSLFNVARGKTTYQSSEHSTSLYPSSKAVDGNTSGRNLDFTHTKATSNPWWLVILDDVYEIHGINVYNRADCNSSCRDRLKGFEVSILGRTVYKQKGKLERVTRIPFGGSVLGPNYHGMQPIVGNAVKITLPGSNRILSLAEVEVWGKPHIGNIGNIALNKPTSQSSTYPNGPSSKAVDGIKDGAFETGDRSVTHTVRNGSNPWWNVDLQSLYAISKIEIYNRRDCCSSRLSGFKVTVFNGGRATWTWTHSGGTPGAKTTLTLPTTAIGDKVEVKIPGSNKILSLAEVEVYGKEVKNIALNKPTSQSSTYPNGPSSKAVDGIKDGAFETGARSVTHTVRNGSNPWWNVDLQSLYAISKIEIYNRRDCCSSRLSGFKVTVFNGGRATWTWTHSGGTPGAKTTLTLPTTAIGDKVEVMIPGSNKILSLAEVEVYGKKQNVALNKPTAQSSNFYSGGLGFSDKAVDGIKDGLMRSGARSVTHTRKENNPWWNVDLESQYSISEIKVYDRTDCAGCEGRLSGFKVTVFNGGRATWTWTHGGGIPSVVTTLTLPPSAIGDKVEVMSRRNNKILSLAEVEIFGKLLR